MNEAILVPPPLLLLLLALLLLAGPGDGLVVHSADGVVEETLFNSPYFQQGNVATPFLVHTQLFLDAVDADSMCNGEIPDAVRGKIVHATPRSIPAHCSIKTLLRTCQSKGCAALAASSFNNVPGYDMYSYIDFSGTSDLTTPMVQIGASDAKTLRRIMAHAKAANATLTATIDSSSPLNDNEWEEMYNSPWFAVLFQVPTSLVPALCVYLGVRRFRYHKQAARVRARYGLIPLVCLGLEIACNLVRFVYFSVDPINSRAIFPTPVARFIQSLMLSLSLMSTVLIVVYWNDVIEVSEQETLQFRTPGSVDVELGVVPKADVDGSGAGGAAQLTVPSAHHEQQESLQAESKHSSVRAERSSSADNASSLHVPSSDSLEDKQRDRHRAFLQKRAKVYFAGSVMYLALDVFGVLDDVCFWAIMPFLASVVLYFFFQLFVGLYLLKAGWRVLRKYRQTESERLAMYEDMPRAQRRIRRKTHQKVVRLSKLIVICAVSMFVFCVIMVVVFFVRQPFFHSPGPIAGSWAVLSLMHMISSATQILSF
eukprot:TRINITY_DN59557_c0_g1_i1.p1 TRINITY_DN59557_c0_g1~~TRINITY_DN59557_c0_g1_i1.p1  ORF type:complete len:540 (-),score=205.54 TRINITY_DN59557_c0_g1_i1:94-1713(-)